MRNAIFAVVAAMTFLCGCGGGGAPSPRTFVTRDVEPSLSRDALVLAAGISDQPYLYLDDARKIDSDLKAIRDTNPILASIAARGVAEPRSVLVKLKPEAPWLAAWQAGTLNTGNAAIDNALSGWRATSVEALGVERTFVLRFDQWMNTSRLADALDALSDQFEYVEVNAFLGDGDDIKVIRLGDSYRFTRGWGDCSAGCIYRHSWTASKTPSGGWSVEEAGDPLVE